MKKLHKQFRQLNPALIDHMSKARFLVKDRLSSAYNNELNWNHLRDEAIVKFDLSTTDIALLDSSGLINEVL